MKHLKYIIWIWLVVLCAACEPMVDPNAQVILEQQTVVILDKNSAALKVVFNSTAATIQSVVVCYSTNSDMSNAEECAMKDEGNMTYRVALTNLRSNTTYYVRYKVSNAISACIVAAPPLTTKNSTVNGYEYVDLGLSVKWATCNVGATKPEEYGDYFAWGETEPKEVYDWSTYKWCSGSYYTLTKYCTSSSYGTVDNKETLDLSDDAARANWGGNWRMPTRAEQGELREQCTWTWTTQNGVNGYKVTSKINGKSIFLPAAGYRRSSLLDAGSYGDYWSSSLSTNSPVSSYHLSFYSSGVGWDNNNRYYGQSVRPVYGAREEDTTNETCFSVSETKNVTFSSGNLQYHPANNKWRFAISQTDYIGDANSNCSSTYNGWLDLFGWSTSSTNFGVSTSTDNDHYSGSFVDWGTNKIGNDAPNTWRTLTNEEWEYLRYTRTNANDLVGVAQVNGVNGLILLPDNWTCPSGVTFKSGSHSNYGVDYYAAYQTFTAAQWTKLEIAGAVFLPAAGCRDGTSVGGVQNYGRYWSATERTSLSAHYLDFYSGGAYMGDYYRNRGHSVRLVKDL